MEVGGGRMFVFVRDIVERKHVEEVLREYQKALESSQDMIAVVDRNYNYLIANNMFLKYRGMDREQVVGRSVSEVLGKDVFERVIKKTLDTCFQGESVQYEMKYTYPELGERDLLVSYFPIEDPDGVNRVASVIRDITERKQAEEALQESERRFRDLYDHAPLGYHEYNKDGRITQVNQTDLDMLGYSGEEMIGQYIWKFNVGEERVREEVLEKLAGKRPPGRALHRTYRRKDGTTFPVLIEDRLIRDKEGQIKGIRCTIQDISELKQAEEALQAERQRFQILSEYAPFGMVMIDRDGTFRYINPKFTELFGYDLKDIPDGKTWFRKAFPDPTYRHNVISAWINDSKIFASGEKRPRVFTATCKDGTEKIVSLISVQLEMGDYLMTCEDITEHIHFE